MRKADVIAHFGSARKLAKALGINKSAVFQWPDPIPKGRAYELQVKTRGKLKVDESLYPNEAA